MKLKKSIALLTFFFCLQGAIAFSGSCSGNVCNVTNCTELQSIKDDCDIGDCGKTYQLVNNIDCFDTINWNIDECGTFENEGTCWDEGCEWSTVEVGHCENEGGVAWWCYANNELECIDCDANDARDIYWDNSTEECMAHPYLSQGQTCNDSRNICWLNCMGDWFVDYTTQGCVTPEQSPDNKAGFEPIGNGATPFTGTFNGNWKKITGIYINNPTTVTGEDVGLFGNVYLGEIKNVGLENINIIGFWKVGGLVGYCYQCNVSNSYSTGQVTGDRSAGGLVGNNAGNIFESFSNAKINKLDDYSYGSLGGLVGDNNGNIINCYSRGNVNGTWGTGGLAGWNFGIINNSYATGNVTGTSRVGGLVGHDLANPAGGGSEYDDSSGKIINSYATGTTTGTSYVGGIIGFTAGKIINCSWNNRTNDNADYCYNEKQRCSCPPGPPFICSIPCNNPVPSSACCASKGGTYHAGGPGNNNCTAIADNESFFFYNQSEPMDAWDFNNIWGICEGKDYPWLLWQGLVCPCSSDDDCFDDDNPCTDKHCNNGVCEQIPKCNEEEVCEGGECIPKKPNNNIPEFNSETIIIIAVIAVIVFAFAMKKK
jgi:hypothetical protein